MKRTLAIAITALIAAALVVGCGSASKEKDALTVSTTSGTLHGKATATAKEWLGVRYAKPPVGSLRWALPQPPAKPDGTVEATHVGSRCPQGGATPGTKASVDEDCLFLNVTTPKNATPGSRLPVMVWWHGGGYTSGDGGSYDAEQLASAGHVMVVTVNYRLGIFGYFGLPGLAGSGNFGFADQLAALRWARTNAGAFGGNADDVTVFGQSAGGMSTCALLTSPEASGLIQRAAVMSGDCRLDWPTNALLPGVPASTPYTSLATDQFDGQAAAASLGCKGGAALACLRAKPAKALLADDEDFANHLAYGTALLPSDPATALAAGKFAPVPVISGGTRYEERSFVAGTLEADPKAVTAANYGQLIQGAFGAAATPAVEAHYPLSAYPSAGMAWSTLTTDASWSCPTVTANQQLAAHTTVFPYEFADPAAPNVNGVKAPGMTLGDTHAADMPYLFHLGGLDLLQGAGSHQLSAQMIAAWTSFARTGTPNFPGTTWAPATTSSTSALQLVPGTVKPVDVAKEHQCGFWASVPYGQ